MLDEYNPDDEYVEDEFSDGFIVLDEDEARRYWCEECEEMHDYDD